ncbi:intradiol ring-cleavage dioxygenase [Hymenobacter sp. BT635]|uniref:Intradiol ring-cleavage dioxygenase n=1 Tax=Hymenobacter nitidus TaxID=2880929 RepID=A0ABS8AIR8_9BACT|nr:intradiol ring-cleavage dioxygenase [Hymenobacter nitidus]MCB2379761.1 intradiol ring-cleavage dioxygenase [Hymenobacter nitidus]
METRRSTTVFQILLVGSSCYMGACGETNSPPAAAKDPCDNPDAAISCCFTNAPASLTSVLTMGNRHTPGEPLRIFGTLLRADGKTPYAGVLLYAYQTGHTGHYTRKGNETGVQKWHGQLHGWARSDRLGRYEIRSVRPAPYPSRTMPAHIHAAIQEPGGQAPYYISDFVFADDPLITAQYLTALPEVGGSGVVMVRRTKAGSWVGQRDIILKN